MYVYVYIYDIKKPTGGLNAQAWMDPRVVLGVFVEGLRSNFWGLACPAYCVQPSVGILGFCVLLGWLLGFGSAVALFLRFGTLWTFACPSQPASGQPGTAHTQPSRAQVLAAYLHEPRPRQPTRRS